MEVLLVLELGSTKVRDFVLKKGEGRFLIEEYRFNKGNQKNMLAVGAGY